MMSVLSRLAVSLNRRDEVPNQELARLLAEKKDLKGIKEIVDNLHNKNKNIQSDCIKVLDELGEIDPSLVAPYAPELLALLDHKNNRMQWGAMAALDAITNENPALIFKNLTKILTAAEKGSVITKDRCMSILIKLCATKKYSEPAFSLLFEQLFKSLPNQLPMYAENISPVVNGQVRGQFIKILSLRLPDIEKESGKKRLEKIIRKFS
jgi:hypothetical protein